MESYIYRHHDESLCAIVLSKEGKKFIDNVERFCTNWEHLIDEAKSGFAGFPFYEETVNYDVGFWDKYLDVFEGCNEDYELLLGTYNGEIVVDSEPLENKGEYFDTLFGVMEIAERYNFNTLLDVIYRKDYIILSSKTTLLVCTNTKVPFEPNNEQKILRETIRKRLKSLDSFGEQVLYAKYGCTESQMNDIENVLFYNIGTSFFKNAVERKTSVYFERIPTNEVYVTEKFQFRYIYYYSCLPKCENTCWWERRLVCEWDKIPLKKMHSGTKPFDYYSVIKNNPSSVKCYCDAGGRTLGLRVKLFIPKRKTAFNVLKVIKPLIDGIICAFHPPCDIMTNEVSKLLSAEEEMFLSTENTCLEKCCYVRPYRNSVKWNPQDDRLDCVFIEPVIIDEDEFSFSGKIFALPNYM